MGFSATPSGGSSRVFDPDRLGHDWRGLAHRVSFVALGIVHAALGLQAFRVYRGLSAGSGISERDVATEAFAWPFGDWLVVLAGSASSGLPCSRSIAGWFRDASEVGTTAASLRILAAQPGGLGRWLLGVTAAGFGAYGFYKIIHARYLHIRIKR